MNKGLNFHGWEPLTLFRRNSSRCFSSLALAISRTMDARQFWDALAILLIFMVLFFLALLLSFPAWGRPGCPEEPAKEMDLGVQAGWGDSAAFVSSQERRAALRVKPPNSPSETFWTPPVSVKRTQDTRERPSPSSITSQLSFAIFLSGFFPKSLRKGLLKADLNTKADTSLSHQ